MGAAAAAALALGATACGSTDASARPWLLEYDGTCPVPTEGLCVVDASGRARGAPVDLDNGSLVDVAFGRATAVYLDGGQEGATRTSVVIVSPTGEDQQPIFTFNGFPGGTPAWNPAATRIAVMVAPGDPEFQPQPVGTPTGLWVVDADGSHPHRVAADTNGDVAWSPDGADLVYETTGVDGGIDPAAKVEVVSADGGVPHQVGTAVNAAGDTPTLSWSPDGSHILVTSPPGGPPGSGGVQIIDVHGGSRTLWRNTSATLWSSAQYTPDGRIVVGRGNARGPYDYAILLFDNRGEDPVTLVPSGRNGGLYQLIPASDVPSPPDATGRGGQPSPQPAPTTLSSAAAATPTGQP